MKKLFSIKSVVTMALLMLLLLSAFASMTMLVNAAKFKEPNILITGSGSVVLTGKSGKTQTIRSTGNVDVYVNLGGLDTVTFIPTRGWHITAVLIDGDTPATFDVDEDEDWFSLTGVRVKNSISVSFVANTGVDDVGTGDSVESYPTPEVFLIFTNVESGGSAYAYDYGGVEIYVPPPPDPNVNDETLDIWTDATVIFEGVTVILVVSLDDLPELFDAEDLRLWGADFKVALADVTLDGVVDGDDVSTVANANPSQVDETNYRLNQNNDKVIDDEDVNIVNNYNGQSVWEDITTYVDVDIDAGFAYVHGDTDHFSLFHGF